MSRALRIAAVIVALVVGLVAPGPAQVQVAGGSLIVQAPAEPPGLDLTASPASAIAAVVHYNIQECLVRIDKSGKLLPWLAERWYSTDNLNYTFFLKKGVKFHNGREFKAPDVKFVLERALNPETKHPHRKHYEDIAAIHVGDDYTVTVSLKRVNASFLLNLARQGSVIYPREAADTLKSHPVGTGPFVFSDWVRGDRIVLAKNKDYHVKGLPYLDRITFRFIPDPNSALAALKAGDVDVLAFGLGPESVPELKSDPRFAVIQGDTTNDVILALNNSRKPFDDVRVRRAITHAINKEEVIKGAMFGLGRPLGSNIDPLNPYHVDMARAVPHDPERAKKLLAESGYPNGFETVLKVPPQYYYTVRSGEVIVNQLTKVGIKVKLEQIEWGQWLARIYRNADYDMTIIGHAESWDAGNYANPGYYFRYNSSKFQKVYAESEVTLDEKKRRELYLQLQKIMVEEAPVVWLFVHPRLVATKKGVQGIWKDLPTPSMDLSEVYWAR
ncbi:MAG: ABC transporter substrate-binding protein [Candidatus Rokubacteria bacterium]|nr:ABC transporter substrate-binding protein [Candidatus Rokubacteria bacterium]